MEHREPIIWTSTGFFFVPTIKGTKASFLYVDVHFSKDDPKTLESPAKSKTRLYEAAFKYFEGNGNCDDAYPTSGDLSSDD